MIYSTMAIAWVVSFIYSIVGGIVYSAVIDGVCYVYMTYENEVSKVVVIVISFLLLSSYWSSFSFATGAF